MEIMSIRREKTSKVLELQTDLADKIEEVISLNNFTNLFAF